MFYFIAGLVTAVALAIGVLVLVMWGTLSGPVEPKREMGKKPQDPPAPRKPLEVKVLLKVIGEVFPRSSKDKAHFLQLARAAAPRALTVEEEEGLWAYWCDLTPAPPQTVYSPKPRPKIPV